MRYTQFKKFTKSILLVIAFIGGSFSFVWAGGLEADHRAPSSQQPRIEIEEQSGVPIIDITKSSPEGVSHNVFKEYNVGEEGIVFNNNADRAPEWRSDNLSILAERPLFVNDNLAGRAAEIILAEVSGCNISNLLGPTEIYGKRADFILANPNGIYCNGASFINVHRVTLTTGRPEIDVKGILNALKVDRGTIEIHANGLTIPVVQGEAGPLEILSRAVKISGTLTNPDAVYIYTGKNKFDYVNKTLKAQQDTESNSKPYLAIDGALVGKIGARKITIIATEQGVGVNCPPLEADADNIEITVDGNIKLKDIQTVKDLLVTSQSGDIAQEARKSIAQKGCQLQAQQGKISLFVQKFHINDQTHFSSKELHLDAQTKLWVGKDASENVSLNLSIQDKIDNQGSMYIPHLIVSPLKNFLNRGTLVTQQDLNITSQTVHNQGEIIVEQGVCNLTGDLCIQNGGTIDGNKGLVLSTQAKLGNTGKLASDQVITLSAKSFEQQGSLVGKGLVKIETTGQLINKGDIKGTQLVHMQAGHLKNLGTICGEGEIQIKETQSIANQGTLKTTGNLGLITSKLHNEGTIASEKNKVALTVKDKIVNKNLIVGETQVAINTQGKVDNQGQVISNKENLVITAKDLTNTGRLYGHVGQNLHIQESLENKEIINTQGHLLIEVPQVTNQGILSGRQQLTIQAQTLDNAKEINSLEGDAHLVIKQKFTNQKEAKLVGAKDLSLQANEVINQGSIKAAKELDLQIMRLANEGSLTAASWQSQPFHSVHNIGLLEIQSGIVLISDYLHNTGNFLSPAGKITATVHGTFTNEKEVYASEDIHIQVDNKFSNSGTIHADKSQRIVTGSLENRGFIFAKEGTSTLRVTHQLTNSGEIVSQGDHKVAAGSFSNQGHIKADGSMKVLITAKFINQGLIRGHQHVALQAHKLKNAQQIDAPTGDISLTLTKKFTNQTGARVVSATGLLLHAPTVVNEGHVQASRTLDLRVDNLTNCGELSGGSLSATPLKTIRNKGLLKIQADATINSGSLKNKGGIVCIEGGELRLVVEEKLRNTAKGDMQAIEKEEKQKSGTIWADNGQHITAGSLDNRAQIHTQGPLIVETTQEAVNTGALYAGTQLILQSKATLVNEGSIVAQDNAQVIVKDKLTNLGSLHSDKDIHVQSQAEAIDNKGSITAIGDIMVKANSDIVQRGGLKSGKKLEITTQGNLNNVGTIHPTTELYVQSQSFTNNGEINITQGDLAITAETDFTASKGSIITQQGNLYLTATTGNLYNIGATLSSHKDLTLIAQGEIQSKQVVKAIENLIIQARALTNSGEIVTEKGIITIKKLSDKLHNTNKIQSGSQLEIEVGTCANEGKMCAAGRLELQVDNLENQKEGQLQAQEAHITASNYLYNAKEINVVDSLTIEAGRLNNVGEIQANQDLTITTKQGNLDNSGEIGSEKGNSSITVRGSLTNGKEIKSYSNLTLVVDQALKNTGQLMAEQKLEVKANHIDNSGKIVGKSNVHVSTTTDLVNAGVVGSQKDLILSIEKQLKNTDKGKIGQVQGKFILNAYSLHNAGEIAFYTTNQQDSLQLIQVKDFIYNTGTIKTPGSLELKVPKRIENGGTMVAEQNLALKAPVIKHLCGHVQSNKGDVSLIATTCLYNAAVLDAPQGTLMIVTDHLDNQTDIKLGKNLILNIQNLDNSHTISSKGSFQLNLQTLINRTNGLLAGGEGKSELTVARKLENYGQIFTRGSLSIRATKVEIVNQGKLVANNSLSLCARNLLNEQLLQGGEVTTLTIAEKVTNNDVIASVNDLEIKAQKLQTNRSNTKPKIQANRHMTLQVDELGGNILSGGKGNTILTIQEDFVSHNLISSQGNLLVTTKRLENYSHIVAANTLEIRADRIVNYSGAHLQGGKGSVREGKGNSRLESKGDIHNNGHITGEEGLTLRSGGEIINQGMLQAADKLHLVAHSVSNSESRVIFSGGDMHIQAEHIKNNQGNIFTKGNIVLEGKENDQPAEKVNNITGDYEARIEARGDITIRAKELENKGQKSSGNNYYTNSRHVGSPGDGSYAVTDEKEVISTMTTKPAYIKATDNLHLDILEKGVNYGGVITCGKNMNIGGRSIKNTRPFEEVSISNYYRYEKRWIEKKVNAARVLATVFTAIVTVGAIPNGHGIRDEIEHSASRYENKTVTIYSTNEPICRSGETMQIDAKEFQNGILVESTNVAPTADPLKELEKNSGTISTSSSIQIPQGDYGMFRLQLDPYAPEPIPQSTIAPQVQVGKINFPAFDTPSMPTIDTGLDSFLSKILAPRDGELENIRETAEPAHVQAGHNEEGAGNFTTSQIDFDKRAFTTTTRSRTTRVDTEKVEGSSSYRPSSSTIDAENVQATDPGKPNYDMPTKDDLPCNAQDRTSGKTSAYEPPPVQENIKVTVLPPLMRTNVPVDQAKYYGSPYFLRHVGLDFDRPLRFLGDPFYESRLINNAIYKQTARPFLYDNVATPEEQVKCLIDNTAEATKDLKLSLGVALSKDQINTLKKDILWYVEEEVVGQKVLVPQIYLTQTTIANLRLGKGNGVYSRGDMNLKVAGAMTNTGNIGAGGNQTIRAESLRNESFGNTQATIGAGGIADIQTKKNIENVSGAISGQKGTNLVSKEGQILNRTKLLNDSTLHMQANISSGGDLLMKAKGDIINQAASIKAVGNGTIISETGDFKNLTQEVKKVHTETSSSHQDGFWSSKSNSHTKTETATTQEVSSIEIGKNLTTKARDITFMGTKVEVQGDAAIEASRNLQALAVQDIEETSTHTEKHTKERGLFTSQSNSTSSSSHDKKVTSKGPSFKIGGKMGVKTGGNAEFEGANVDAGAVDMDVQGKTTIRKAYNEETHESNSSTDEKNEALFGLIKNNQGNTTTSKKYDKTGVGNNWTVRDKFNLKGKEDVVTQGIDLTAHHIHIESTEGNVFDKAVEEIHEDYEETNSYKLRQGIIDNESGKTQANQGRAAWKLREKQEEKRVVKDKNKTAQSSSFKTIARVETTEDGETIITPGNATFKAAEKVVLEGTDMDIEGKLSLQGTKGVDIIEKKETTEHEEHKENYTEEVSLGIKNSFIAAGYQAKELKEAFEQVGKAKKAYDSYEAQCRQAKKLLDRGDITKEEYDEVAAEKKYHLEAIAAATLNATTKSKKFLSTAAQAVKTAGTTFGTSIDLQADINKVVEEFMSYAEKAKGSNIITQQLEIITEGTAKVRGSQIHSEETTIDARDVVVEAFEGKNKTRTEGYSAGVNATLELAPNPSLDLSLHGDITRGHNDGVQHTNSMLNLGNTTFNVKQGVTIRGAQVKTTSLDGEIGGKLHVETLQDTQKGHQYTAGGSIGLGFKPGFGSTSIGFNGNTSQQDDKWAQEASSLTTSGELKLKVGGETKLVGAHLGSDSGQMHLETEKVELEDLEGHKKGSSWGGGVNLTGRKAHGSGKAAYDVNANLQYSRNSAKQKIRASLGQGAVMQTGSTRSKLNRRATQQGPVNYLDTQSEVKVDSDMVKLVVNPVKVAKEVVEDSKIIYNTGKLVGEATSKIGESGLVGTVEAMRLGLAAGGAAMDMAKEENETQKLGKAATTEEFKEAINEEGAKLQVKMGVKNPAEVEPYQGDADELKGKAASRHKASFNKKENTINYNTSRKDFNQVETVAEDMAHESTHKVMSESKVTKQFINSKQEEKVSEIVGNHARRMASIIKDENKTQPTMDWKKWNAENKGSQVFRDNNSKLARTNPRELKASPQAEMYLEWKKLSPEEQDKAARTFLSFVPVVGSGLGLYEGFKEGNKVKQRINLTFLGLDLISVGATSAVAKGGAKMLAKKGTQEVFKQVEKQIVKEGVELVEKAAVKQGMQEGIMKGGEAVVEETIKVGKKIVPGASSNILGWGKNATGHLIKHREVLGFGNISAQQAQKLLPQLRRAANQLLNSANPALTRVGNWHNVQNARFYIANGKMLVTYSNGEFLTIINKSANKWYNAATFLK